MSQEILEQSSQSGSSRSDVEQAFRQGQEQPNSKDKILFYLLYENSDVREGRICLFDSHTNSVKQITTFTNHYDPDEVATTPNKIFGINSGNKSFEIYDLNTRRISRGPDPPEWRIYASVAYYKDKLYYLGGKDPKTWQDTKRVDVLIDGEWQTGPAFPLPIIGAQAITCDGNLYVIDGADSKKIYRLSDDEREWIEIGEIPERREFFGVASLNGKIYITGGRNFDYFDGLAVFKSCLCFDPSASIDSQISPITDMNYERYNHSLIVANGKLYAVGGSDEHFRDSIEEYDPQTNKWQEVGKIWHKILFYRYYYRYNNDNNEGEEGICLFNSSTCSIEEIAKFHNSYKPYQVATTQNKIFGISNIENIKSFEIFDLSTRQILKAPDPPEWHKWASVAYFKDKLYYLGGNTNRVDVLIGGKWQTGPAFPFPIRLAQTITCDESLYVIDGNDSRKIYRLSDDEREWTEVGEIPEGRDSFEIASLNGKIYITGGENGGGHVFKSCLCFDPSAPVGSRISRIADMSYTREHHSLIVANGKLYAIGGFQKDFCVNYCKSIEEYDPALNGWKVLSYLPVEASSDDEREPEEKIASKDRSRTDKNAPQEDETKSRLGPMSFPEEIKNCLEGATKCIDSCLRIETALEELVTTLRKVNKPESSTENENVNKAAKTVVDTCEAAVGSANSLIINCSSASYTIRRNYSGISVQQSEEYFKFVNKVSDIANELKSLIETAKQYAKSEASVDKIKILQESINNVRNKLVEARDAISMFGDGDKMKQIIDSNPPRPSNHDLEEMGKIEESKGSDAEKLQNTQPTQSPDFTSIKNAILMSLSKCTNSPPLPYGLAEDFLDYVFFFCVGCREYSLIAIGQFTSEKGQLEKDLLDAIPHLEANLRDTYNNLGGESVAGFRRTRSGLQFLQDDIVFEQSNVDVDILMDKLMRSDFVKEIDRRLRYWKEMGEWNPHDVLDLRFVPSSHDWWLEEQRKASKQKYDARDEKKLNFEKFGAKTTIKNWVPVSKP